MTFCWCLRFVGLSFLYTTEAFSNSFHILSLLLWISLLVVFFFFFGASSPYPWTWLMKYFIFPIFPEKFYGTLWPILLYFFLSLFLPSTLQSSLHTTSEEFSSCLTLSHSSCKVSAATPLPRRLFRSSPLSVLMVTFPYNWASCMLSTLPFYREYDFPRFILNPYYVIKRQQETNQQ